MSVSPKKLVLAGLFLALGLALPFFTMQIQTLGQMLLPMHIPVLLAGFALGGPYGLLIGLYVPVLRSFFFGLPPMFPTAAAMSFELATYGLVTGYLYKVLPKKNWAIYFSLFMAMILGRAVWGLANLLFFGLLDSAFSWKLFLTGAFLDAYPGIILQVILIPLLVLALKRAKLLITEE